MRHCLTDHALLQLPRLIELATVLPESSVEYNQADLPIEQEYLATPRNGLTIDQTIRQIEECHSWMVLKNVERNPPYKALLDECLEEIAPHVRTMSPQLENREAFVFVSSPQAVTPYHCDPEHNFLLQIRGDKVDDDLRSLRSACDQRTAYGSHGVRRAPESAIYGRHGGPRPAVPAGAGRWGARAHVLSPLGARRGGGLHLSERDVSLAGQCPARRRPARERATSQTWNESSSALPIVLARSRQTGR